MSATESSSDALRRAWPAGFAPERTLWFGLELGEIDRFPVLDTAFAGGKGEQRVDELFLLVTELEGFSAPPPPNNSSSR